MIRVDELDQQRRNLAFVEAVRRLLESDRHTDPVPHWFEPDRKLRTVEALLAICDGKGPAR